MKQRNQAIARDSRKENKEGGRRKKINAIEILVLARSGFLVFRAGRGGDERDDGERI
jgi:hypothetical protein